MVVGLMGCVGSDNVPQQHPEDGVWESGPVHGGTGGDGAGLPGLPGGQGGQGGYGGHYNSSIPGQPPQSRQNGYQHPLYGYCLELASTSTKRRWKDYMSSDDHIEKSNSPLYCERFAESPSKLLESAKRNPRNDGRDGASYHGGYGGKSGTAGSGIGGGRAGSGGAGISGGTGGKGGDGGNAY